MNTGAPMNTLNICSFKFDVGMNEEFCLLKMYEIF